MKITWAVVMVFACSLPAQAALLRVPHPGRVLAADGTPVALAEVTLLSLERDLIDGGPDLVRVVADAKGRFRAQVLPTCGYRVWATRPCGEGVEVSPVVALALPASEVRFAEGGKAAVAKVHLRGFAKWKDAGPLRVRITVGGAPLKPEQDVDAEGNFAVPPLAACEVEVFVSSGGSLVFHAGFHDGFHDAFGGGAMVALPAPRRVRAAAIDGLGKPLAGVRIDRLAMMWRTSDGPFPLGMSCVRSEVATTDAEGKAEWWVAHDADLRQGVGYPPLVFVAEAKGLRGGTAGFTRSVFCNKEVVKPDGGDCRLRFVLLKGEAMPCSVTGGGPGVAVVVDGMHTVPVDGNGATSFAGEFPLPGNDADASGLPATFQAQITRVCGVVPKLLADDPFRRAVAPHAMRLGAPSAGGLALDLTEVLPLRLQWIDDTGGPAMGAQVVCLPLDAIAGACVGVPAIADAAGRLVLPVVPGRYFLCAVRGSAWASQEVEVEPGQAPLTLHLQPLDQARLRVVDAAGKPVAGARLTRTGASWTNAPGVVEDYLCDLAYHLASFHLDRAVTDAEGLVTVPFLARRQQKIDFEVSSDRGKSGELRLVASEAELLDVVVK